ncbi:MAG: DUF1566 domain-containing protein [Ectothiorhodospiraceae bacterium]|nr:DUF1566 domain-containing protein [Ectothiorhodospiraceae bacterium]
MNLKLLQILPTIITALYYSELRAEPVLEQGAASIQSSQQSKPVSLSRYVPLDAAGMPIVASHLPSLEEWPCVLDRNTGLTWESKSQLPGLHYHHNTYHWFQPEPGHNGGQPGQHGGNRCRTNSSVARQLTSVDADTVCDTHRFVNAVNQEALCGQRDWRLPHREELRSLVDYNIRYPGPTIDLQAFPNTVAQFYWSADTAAAAPLEAWGIGFSFGFDYAYFKSNQVHLRLVRGVFSYKSPREPSSQ